MMMVLMVPWREVMYAVMPAAWTSAAPVRACEQARCKNGKSNR